MKKTFDFDPDLWFGNQALRICSPGARGLWIDMLGLCFRGGGYLTINGQPIDAPRLARIVGEPIREIRAWLKELDEAGICDLTPDGNIFSSKMVRNSKFVDQAKMYGEEGQKRKKSRVGVIREAPIHDNSANDQINQHLAHQKKPEDQPKKFSKPLDWYQTPAGWARKGSEQGVTMVEDFEEFKFLVAKRMPRGPHLDHVQPHYRNAVLAEIEKYEAKPKGQ